MEVAKIPPLLTTHRFLSIGAIGFVYQIDSCIAAKYPRDQDDEAFSQEMDMFDVFEKHSPCPDIVQSLLRVPDGKSLAYLQERNLRPAFAKRKSTPLSR
jgi:hypothetical protein